MPRVVTMDGDKDVKTDMLIAVLLVLLTDWDNVQERQGRRGTYVTTGALSTRFREVPDEVQQAVRQSLEVLGIYLNEEDLDLFFDGEHEYQVSHAINRFAMTGGKDRPLTANEMKSIDRVKALLQRKGGAVTDRLAS